MFARFTNRQRLAALVAGCLILAVVANFRTILPEPPYVAQSHSPPSVSSKPHDVPTAPSNSNSPASELNAAPAKSAVAASPGCRAYPEAADVVIVVKTGATEAFQKIPTQILTFLQCAGDDVLFFSDMEQEIGGYHIHDSLDKVVEETKKENPDFDLYDTQNQYQLLGDDVSTLSNRGSDAWKLDKYKNIHTAQKAWELKPNKSWYFFIDADTYIVWANFFQWLKKHDPAEKLYLGSKVNDGVPPFAHGGSGYLLSGAAMAELNGKDKAEIAAKYDAAAIPGCCGDQELGRTLSWDKGINITNQRPMINGDRPRNLPYGPVQWCQPIVTMHHMTPEEINNMWQYENARTDPLEILLIQKIYDDLIAPIIIPFREDWDNLAVDDRYTRPSPSENEPSKLGGFFTPSQPYDSFNACRKFCRDNPRCFQFIYYGETCATSNSFKLGNHRPQRDGVTYTSGWLTEKIDRFKKENSPCRVPFWGESDL